MGTIAHRWAADISPRRVDWLWPGWLPAGAFVGMIGRQGDGKGTVLAGVIGAVSTGSPLPDGHRPDPGVCALLSLEDDTERTVVPRLLAAGADLGRVAVMDGVDAVGEDGEPFRRQWSMPADLDALGAFIADQGVSLLVLDPVGYMIRTRDDRYGEVGAVLIALRDIAEATGCTIVGVRHLRKSGATDAREAGIGSVAWTAVVRVELVVGRDPEDETGRARVLAQSKNNLAPEAPSIGYRIVTDEVYDVGRVQWLGASSITAGGLTAGYAEPDVSDRVEARELLAVLLADGPVPSTEVIAACEKEGIGERTLRKAKRDLNVRSEKAGLGGGWVWVLPEGCNSPETDAALQPSALALSDVDETPGNGPRLQHCKAASPSEELLQPSERLQPSEEP